MTDSALSHSSCACLRALGVLFCAVTSTSSAIRPGSRPITPPTSAVKHTVAVCAAISRSEFLSDDQAALLVQHVLRSVTDGESS